MEQCQIIQTNVGQSLEAWKALQKASVSLIVFNKREDSLCFILPTFRDSKAAFSFHASTCSRLNVFVIWDLLEKSILKVKVTNYFKEYLRAIKAASGNRELEFLVTLEVISKAMFSILSSNGWVQRKCQGCLYIKISMYIHTSLTNIFPTL